MAVPAPVARIAALAPAVTRAVGWLGPLLARLVVGYVFLRSGWGKLHGLDGVTEYFESLHIPAPHLNAIVASSTELLGGLALIAGALTRFAAIPLTVTMVVAIATAKWGDLEGLGDFLRLEELHYILIFVWLAVAGAGAASLDHLVARRLGLVKPATPLPQSASLPATN